MSHEVRTCAGIHIIQLTCSVGQLERQSGGSGNGSGSGSGSGSGAVAAAARLRRRCRSETENGGMHGGMVEWRMAETVRRPEGTAKVSAHVWRQDAWLSNNGWSAVCWMVGGMRNERHGTAVQSAKRRGGRAAYRCSLMLATRVSVVPCERADGTEGDVRRGGRASGGVSGTGVLGIVLSLFRARPSAALPPTVVAHTTHPPHTQSSRCGCWDFWWWHASMVDPPTSSTARADMKTQMKEGAKRDWSTTSIATTFLTPSNCTRAARKLYLRDMRR